MFIYFSLLVALIGVLMSLIGVLMFALATGSPSKEIGKIMFFCGLLAFLFGFAGQGVSLLHR